MGKNALEHLRKEAEQAIADAERWSDNEGSAAIAKTLMYVGELLATSLSGPRIEMPPPKIEVKEYHPVQERVDTHNICRLNLRHCPANRMEESRATDHPPKIEIEYQTPQNMGKCAGCEGQFPESALNYSSGDPFCANCQKVWSTNMANPRR